MKGLRKPILALLKLGFGLNDIMAMPEEEMMAWIEGYGELINHQNTRTYKVRKKDRTP